MTNNPENQNQEQQNHDAAHHYVDRLRPEVEQLAPLDEAHAKALKPGAVEREHWAKNLGKLPGRINAFKSDDERSL